MQIPPSASGRAITTQIVSTPLFRHAPFTLVDVGCSGGIDPRWRAFEPNLEVHGFDPQIRECRRLADLEMNPRCFYHAVRVGLPDDHPFVSARARADAVAEQVNPFARSSCFRPRRAGPPPDALPTVHWHGAELSTDTISIDTFIRDRAVDNVDFIKVDTDGSDLEVLLSASETLRSHRVLGVLSEFVFHGALDETSNCFGNIDRFMRSQGFLLYDIGAFRYSRAALPARFVFGFESATVSGQVFQGDALYLRDGCADEIVSASDDLDLVKTAKLICLYELFGFPDCAAELIARVEAPLDALVNTRRLLDSLVPEIDGVVLDYDSYIDYFDFHRERFLRRPSVHSE